MTHCPEGLVTLGQSPSQQHPACPAALDPNASLPNATRRTTHSLRFMFDLTKHEKESREERHDNAGQMFLEEDPYHRTFFTYRFVPPIPTVPGTRKC